MAAAGAALRTCGRRPHAAAVIAPKRVLLSWSSGKDSAWALHALRGRSDIEVVIGGHDAGRGARPGPLEEQEIVLVVGAGRLGTEPSDRGDPAAGIFRERSQGPADVGDGPKLGAVGGTLQVGRDGEEVDVLGAEPRLRSAVGKKEDPLAVARPARGHLLEPSGGERAFEKGG